MGRAHFFRNVKNLTELKLKTHKSLLENEHDSKFCVKESVLLLNEEFEHFTENFMKTHDFVTAHRAFLGVNELYEYVCLSITSSNADTIVLVNTSGYSYARNVAIVYKNLQMN